MVGQEGGRWDVGTKDKAVYLERVSESDERVFDDLLAADEARALAGLLAKYADKLDAAEDSRKSDDSDETNNSEDADAADEPEDSGKSDDSDDSKDSEDADESSA
ncbi:MULTISPECIES: hypothetical protein [unclassified Mycobacterium]|uniref:hypothetical protein n=1 Tax=unclassified Mycobacterium TaxID=2642494 RepID=UPI00080187FB|nr:MULTISPECIES: hypothetical protein [unclassified Mycobacterium]OBH00296.1 hypothetical protein A5696_16225 [Mycobacterium sp. E2699]OBI48698.1 hypothetical protein A5705_15130 [Mycobacterium sp. E787]